MDRVAGKVVLVTGAGSGIGRATAKLLHFDFSSTAIGEALPVALKTPPSSIGLRTSAAPARLAMASTWVSAR